MFAAALVGGMSLKTTPADLGKSVNIGEIEMSHMLHFSSWETFLCSSWLCALQAAILQDTQKRLRTGRKFQEEEKQHVIGSKISPALQAIDVLLLLLPALLGRLLIANLSAYFLQNPLFALMERRRCQ